MKRFSVISMILLCSLFFKEAVAQSYRVSLITSVYKGEAFIERFLENITHLTEFEQYQLILINACSPENEEAFILPYLEKYPHNIMYVKLDHDPGVYGVWNVGIKNAKAPYLTNANLDDLRYPDSCKQQADYLDAHPDIALVYTPYNVTDDPKSPIQECRVLNQVVPFEFNKQLMMYCLPGPQPMWRKAVHEKAGFFDESFLYSGDLEFWNRMVKAGYLFGHLPVSAGVYYFNPDGLSTNQVPEKVARRKAEDQRIVDLYLSMWNGIN